MQRHKVTDRLSIPLNSQWIVGVVIFFAIAALLLPNISSAAARSGKGRRTGSIPDGVQSFWTPTNGPNGGDVNALAIDNSNGYVYAGTDSGVYLSTDNGTTWSRSGVAGTSVRTVVVDSAGDVYAGTGSGVYLSTNHGGAWNLSSLQFNTLSLTVSSNGTIYAGIYNYGITYNSGVYISSDHGTTWTQAGFTNSQIYALAVDASGNIFAANYDPNTTANEGVYRSTDNGSTWTQVGLSGVWVWALTIKPSGEIFAGTYEKGVCSSTDGGSNWTVDTTGMTNTMIYSLAVTPIGVLFAGSDGGGVFISTDNGAKWTAAGPTARTYWAMAAGSNGYVYAGADSGGVYRATVATTITYSPPTISSYSPASGPVGTSVTISGTNFSSNSANDVVYFGAVKATVTSASSTSLTVTVPAGATYQPITVTNLQSGLTAYSSKPFVVTFSSGGTIDAGSFSDETSALTGIGPHYLTIGDLDGDGRPDMVVTNAAANNSSNSLSVYRNTGSTGNVTFVSSGDLAAGNTPYAVAVGDLDGDGKPDVVFANEGSNTVSVYRNTSASGSISFAARIDSSTAGGTFGVAIGDLDGDGKPDIVVTNDNANVISIYRNTSTKGTISFAPRIDIASGSRPLIVAIADLDGDGKPDIAVTNSVSNTLSIFRNTSTSGNISFAAKVDFATGSNPQGLAIGDLDGDGKPDIVVTNSSGKSCSIFRNTGTTGTISFAAKQDVTAGTTPVDVAIADLDGDGKPDLVVTNNLDSTISIYHNQSTSGAISFAPGVNASLPGEVYGVAVGDLDGDGRPEIAAVDISNDSVHVFHNAISSTGSIPSTPVLLSPSDGATGVSTNPTLTWNASTSSSSLSYTLEVSTDSTFASIFFDAIGIAGTSKAVSGLTNSTKYYWRVNANSPTASSAWSSVWNFTTTGTTTAAPPAPALISPANSASNVSANPVFLWNYSSGANSYRFQLAANSSFSTPNVDTTGLIVPTDSVYGLASGTTYYWRVNAANSIGTGAWSSVWSFTTAASGQTVTPLPSLPSDNATGIATNPILSWSSSAGATTYEVQVSTQSTFATTVADIKNIVSLSQEIEGLSLGTMYYWRVNASGAAGSSSWSTVWNFTTFSYPSTVSLSASYTPPAQFDSTGYEIIGIPGALDVSIANFMSGNQGVDWNAYYDDGTSSKYLIEDNGSATFNFRPGRAFWILSKNSFNISQSALTVPLDTGDCYAITVHSGWNLISDPFGKKINWSDVQMLNGSAQPAWAFSGGSYSQPITIDPYHGYYFYNDIGATQLRIPYVYNATAGTAQPAPTAPRTITATLTSDDGYQSSITVGAKSGPGESGTRIFAPPGNFARADIAVVDTGSGSGWDQFVRDIRDTIGSGQKFDFFVSNGTGKNLALSFDVSSGLSQYEAYLVDRNLFRSYDLRDTSLVEIPSYGRLENYTILIGNTKFVDAKLAAMTPRNFQLFQNYPNPFNPATAISYQLSAVSEVSLKVYDVLGREVAVLVNEVEKPGRYEVRFDGGRLASGVYFYRLQTGSFTRIKKMVLLK